MNLPGYQPQRRATPGELAQVLDMVRRSRRPIIYAGGGIIASRARRRTSRPSPNGSASPSP